MFETLSLPTPFFRMIADLVSSEFPLLGRH